MIIKHGVTGKLTIIQKGWSSATFTISAPTSQNIHHDVPRHRTHAAHSAEGSDKGSAEGYDKGSAESYNGRYAQSPDEEPDQGSAKVSHREAQLL